MRPLRVSVFVLLLATACTAWSATFDEFLLMGGSEFEGESGRTFISGIKWEDEPEQVYYQCRDRLEKVSLELWQQDGAWVSTRGAKPAPLKFGQHGSIRVFSMTNEAKEPAVAAYFMLPSGETHVFRLQYGEVKLSSIKWHCSVADWRSPPGNP